MCLKTRANFLHNKHASFGAIVIIIAVWRSRMARYGVSAALSLPLVVNNLLIHTQHQLLLCCIYMRHTCPQVSERDRKPRTLRTCKWTEAAKLILIMAWNLPSAPLAECPRRRPQPGVNFLTAKKMHSSSKHSDPLLYFLSDSLLEFPCAVHFFKEVCAVQFLGGACVGIIETYKLARASAM